MARAASKSSAAKLELTFDFEKETPGTRRFKEPDTGSRPAVGTLYVTKAALEDAGLADAKSLVVTIESGDA